MEGVERNAVLPDEPFKDGSSFRANRAREWQYTFRDRYARHRVIR
jgi:hypothetical protein